MAKEASFDVVSQVDLQEVDNAVQQTARELKQRYDLKSSGATIDFSRKDAVFTVAAPSEFIASQVIDVLGTKLVRRGVDLKAVKWADPVPAAGMSVRQRGSVVQGIDQDTAKKIAALKAQLDKVLARSTSRPFAGTSRRLPQVRPCVRWDMSCRASTRTPQSASPRTFAT